MKTKIVLLVILAVVFASTCSNAQSPTEKGRILIDVDYGFHSSEIVMLGVPDTKTDYSQLEFDFNIGYMVMDNLEISVGIILENESSDTKGPYYEMKTTESLSLFMVMARYFFAKEQKLKPFVMLAAGYGPMKSTATGREDIKRNFTLLFGGVGVAYFINEHWGVELGVQYQSGTHHDDDSYEYSYDMDSKAFNINLGTVISF